MTSSSPPAGPLIEAQRVTFNVVASGGPVNILKGLDLAIRAGEAVGIRDLEEATMLTARQIRYALRQPLLDGLVEMTGGQGHKDTRYRLVSARGAGD